MCGRISLGLTDDQIRTEYWGNSTGASARSTQRSNQRRHNASASDQGLSPSPEPEPNVEEEESNDRDGTAGNGRNAVAGSSGAQGSASRDAGGSGGHSNRSIEWYDRQTSALNYRARYNICPQSHSVIVRSAMIPDINLSDIYTTTSKSSESTSCQQVLDLALWGLIPHWHTPPPLPSKLGGSEKKAFNLKTINCRDDTLSSGSSSLWNGVRGGNNRCVVVAQGFYEWLSKGKDKIPYFVKYKPQDGKERLMLMAGLYDTIKYKDSEETLKTFTVVTTSSNSDLSFLHTRMPALLTTPSEIALWLNPSKDWCPEIQDLIRPFGEPLGGSARAGRSKRAELAEGKYVSSKKREEEEMGELEWYIVDRGVGNVRKDDKTFIEPITERKGNIASLFAKQANSPHPAFSPSPSKNITRPSPSPIPARSALPKSSPTSASKATIIETEDSSNLEIETGIDMRINADETDDRKDRDSSIEIMGDNTSPSTLNDGLKRKSDERGERQVKKRKVAPKNSIAQPIDAREKEGLIEVDQEGNGKVTNYFKTG